MLLATAAIAGVMGCDAPADDGAGDPPAPAASQDPAQGGQVRRASGGDAAGAADIPAPPAAAGHRQRPAPHARAVARPDGGPQASAVAAFEQALREAVARHGLVLARFGCGLSLCAGTARGPLRDDGYPFDSGNVFQFDGLRTPMILSGLFETDQHVEIRFSFSTDPNVQSMTLWR